MLSWLKTTEWPDSLKQFVSEFGREPLTDAVTASAEVTQTIGSLKSCLKIAADELAFNSALYLAAGALDQSHSISQDLHTPLGSYLHGIMHRREHDFSNANYWFRQAGQTSFTTGLREALDSNDKATLIAMASSKRPNDMTPAILTDLHRQTITIGKRDPATTELVNNLSWLEWRNIINSLIATT